MGPVDSKRLAVPSLEPQKPRAAVGPQARFGGCAGVGRPFPLQIPSSLDHEQRDDEFELAFRDSDKRWRLCHNLLVSCSTQPDQCLTFAAANAPVTSRFETGAIRRASLSVFYYAASHPESP